MSLYSANGTSLSQIQLMKESGLELSSLLDQIENLRKLGYVFEIHPQHGFRLVQSPDLLMADDLIARMIGIKKSTEKHPIGNQILVFEKTASTNDIVQRLALEGYPEGLSVFAESQSAGRGRHGRRWISPPRKGLWFTTLLRPDLNMQSASRLTTMAAVAVCLSLKRSTQLPLRIKWPNDILCSRRKVGGILVELSGDSDRIHHAAIGIGININMEEADFPDGLRPYATSLKLEAHQSFHRSILAVDLLMELNRCYDFLSDENFSSLLEQWLELDDTLGRQISIHRTDGRKLQGFASSLDPDGALLLRTDEGHMERIVVGEVTLEK